MESRILINAIVKAFKADPIEFTEIGLQYVYFKFRGIPLKVYGDAQVEEKDGEFLISNGRTRLIQAAIRQELAASSQTSNQ